MRKRGRVTIWAITLGAALASVLVAVGLLLSTRDDAKADFPHAGVNFSMGIGAACDSSGTPTATCSQALGSNFKVTVKFNSGGGVLVAGYDSVLNYGAGLSLVNDKPSVPAGGPLQSLVQQGGANNWPPCGFPASFLGTIGTAAVGCGLGIGGVPATYAGPLYQINFVCNGTTSSSETITLNHGAGNTSITDELNVAHGEADGTSEDLDINCFAATPTPTPTMTPTPTNTPDASPTPTPNPNPRMRIETAGGVSCVQDLAVSGDRRCDAKLFAGDEKRSEFDLRIVAFHDTSQITYGGFKTQVDLGSGLTFNSSGCAAEVVWSAGEATCDSSTAGGGSSVRHNVRTSAGPPFDSTTFVGTLVELDIHCATAGDHTITLRTPGGGDPGSAYFSTTNVETAVKAEDPPEDPAHVDVLTVRCTAQTPEMSLSASGPRVTCITAPTPPTPANPAKPDKCVVPFESGVSATQTPFNISVSANVIPASEAPGQDGYGGFDTNVYWAGLKYPTPPKPSCLAESIWPDTLLCQQSPAAPGTFKQHQIRSGLFPPFFASHYAGELLRMSLTCPSLGQFRVVLNGSGTNFVNPLGTAVPVAVVTSGPLDPLTPVPTVVPVVDALLINCQIVPTPTPTGTPTSTPTATATPCPTSCPTATFTASATPTATNTSPPTSTFTPTNTPPPPTFTPTITPTPTPCCEFVNQTLFGPGKVTTDDQEDENDGATGTDQVETSVTITALLGGKVTIDEEDITEPAPAGYTFFGQQVEIAAPGAVPANPLTIAFTLDTSIKPAGANHNTIQVFKNGVKVENCTGPSGTASPNPCITKRHTLAGDPAASGGDVQLTVLTTAASAWNFGVPTDVPGLLGDVNCNGQIDPIDAQLILQFIVGLIQALPCPQNADVDGDGDIDAVDALLILQLDAGIIDSFPAGASSGLLRRLGL